MDRPLEHAADDETGDRGDGARGDVVVDFDLTSAILDSPLALITLEVLQQHVLEADQAGRLLVDLEHGPQSPLEEQQAAGGLLLNEHLAVDTAGGQAGL